MTHFPLLYIDTFDPHEPFQAPKQYVEKYIRRLPQKDYLYGYWTDEDAIGDEELAIIKALYAAKQGGRNRVVEATPTG